MTSTETGAVVVEKVAGKSTVTRCFSKYPLKFIIPNKVGGLKTDAVWIYSLTYGGGIVSGDSISCSFSVGDGCVAVLTTQASTKVYKTLANKCSYQSLEAKVGRDALFVVIPDPVACFSTARYSQRQIFRVLSDSNLVLVDWFTSGRYESGEKWEFGFYKSTNNIFSEDGQPIFLDTANVKRYPGKSSGKCEEDDVWLLAYPRRATGCSVASNSAFHSSKPDFIASCSAFGHMGVGLTIRVAAKTTEAVQQFLCHQLASLEPLLGATPYH